MTDTENIIEGIIIDVDFGYGMKYKDADNLYLKLHIQQFDGFDCIQLFHIDKVGKLLIQFKSDYSRELSLKQLVNRRCYLLDKTVNGVPEAIAVLPPLEYPQYSWIYNDNWD